MIRALVYVVFGILLLGILRSVLGMFGQLFTNATVGPEKPRSAPRSPTTAQELKKDPVCGTFVTPSTDLQKVKDGQTYYFCSSACRDKF